jgi:hypothetical protein
MLMSETCARRALQWGMLTSQPVYGTIMNYRIGIRTQMPKPCLQIMGENTVSRPDQLVGRKMILKFGKNSFIGRIVDLLEEKTPSKSLDNRQGARVEPLG